MVRLVRWISSLSLAAALAGAQGCVLLIDCALVIFPGGGEVIAPGGMEGGKTRAKHIEAEICENRPPETVQERSVAGTPGPSTP